MSITGAWKNEYGSTMILTTIGNIIAGTYKSSTGSTGEYRVSGCQVGRDATAALGQPIALAIDWHSVVDGPSDPSWNWTSGLSGQISIVDGEEVLVLSHMMIASTDFPGLSSTGTYIDKLTYRRVPTSDHAASKNDTEKHMPIDDLSNGKWIAVGGSILNLSVNTDIEKRIGYVTGSIKFSNDSFEVVGFTDINARSNALSLQSIAICAAKPSATEVLSLSGTLNLANRRLHLVSMNSLATASKNSYTQTRISSMSFRHSLSF
jgi:hypothetical protein